MQNLALPGSRPGPESGESEQNAKRRRTLIATFRAKLEAEAAENHSPRSGSVAHERMKLLREMLEGVEAGAREEHTGTQAATATTVEAAAETAELAAAEARR